MIGKIMKFVVVVDRKLALSTYVHDLEAESKRIVKGK